MDYQSTFTMKRLWRIFAVSMAVMFSVLLFFGGRDIQRGMDVWRRSA